MFDLVITGGQVIDAALGIQGRMDIGISQGKIARLAQDISAIEASRVIDASGMIVTAGLIDLHLHVAEGIIPIGLPADEHGVLAGVTTVCDGGSTGASNFPNFKRRVIATAKTKIFCCLNICSAGLAKLPEINSWGDINTNATIGTVEKNLDTVRGIKVRAISPLAENLGIEAIKVAKNVAMDTGVPLMVHIGDARERVDNDHMDEFTLKLLPLLSEGDVLIHTLTWEAGGVIKRDGSVARQLREAIDRGVIIDSANGLYHFSFDIARIAFDQGILPYTISTDLCTVNVKYPVVSLLVTMSKFLALGLSLSQVIGMTTLNPARVLKEDHMRGALKTGMLADISIFKLSLGKYSFSDGKGGGTLESERILQPVLTIKEGVEIAPHYSYNELDK